jgi:hypothetical protein
MHHALRVLFVPTTRSIGFPCPDASSAPRKRKISIDQLALGALGSG